VDLSAQVIAARKAAPTLPLEPWMGSASKEEVCTTLPRVAASCAQAERDLTAWVARARDLGVTWAEIGASLGVTRQSAWERFAKSI
jgi:ATP-dependent Clp protease ATP-binding subunit ClpX